MASDFKNKPFTKDEFPYKDAHEKVHERKEEKPEPAPEREERPHDPWEELLFGDLFGRKAKIEEEPKKEKPIDEKPVDVDKKKKVEEDVKVEKDKDPIFNRISDVLDILERRKKH
ncbi:hypothetical protein [Salsuginibacillus kocurii]|uniref:hypothetical protein n=1 Tax=Salsuginibacillus kocurii TaxID=427078 RepID=UPI0003709A6F|nr:hypothetical protein [Salsuginibacillus kocurii]